MEERLAGGWGLRCLDGGPSVEGTGRSKQLSVAGRRSGSRRLDIDIAGYPTASKTLR